MAANPAKFQVMFLGVKEQELSDFYIDGIYIKPVSSVNLLGVTIDCRLNFQKHVEKVCKSASCKVKALLRIRPYLDLNNAKRLCNAYILSAFNYCPLIWMVGCKSNDGLINKVHKRALRAVYRDFQTPLLELLALDGSVTIHVRNLRALMIEIFKSLNKVNPEFMWQLFSTKSSHYNLRSGKTLKLPPTHTRRYGLNSLIFRGSLLWNTLPNSLKESISLAEFRHRIKGWTGDACSCPVCT